jgi:hypothetical protein
LQQGLVSGGALLPNSWIPLRLPLNLCVQPSRRWVDQRIRCGYCVSFASDLKGRSGKIDRQDSALRRRERVRQRLRRPRVRGQLRPTVGACAAAHIRRDPFEPAQTCGRTPQHRRSRLARRLQVPIHRRAFRSISRAAPTWRPDVCHGLLGFRSQFFRRAHRRGRIPRSPSARAFALHRIHDHLRIIGVIRRNPRGSPSTRSKLCSSPRR